MTRKKVMRFALNFITFFPCMGHTVLWRTRLFFADAAFFDRSGLFLTGAACPVRASQTVGQFGEREPVLGLLRAVGGDVAHGQNHHRLMVGQREEAAHEVGVVVTHPAAA